MATLGLFVYPEKAPPVVSGQDSLAVMRVINAAYHAAQTQVPVMALKPG